MNDPSKKQVQFSAWCLVGSVLVTFGTFGFAILYQRTAFRLIGHQLFVFLVVPAPFISGILSAAGVANLFERWLWFAIVGVPLGLGAGCFVAYWSVILLYPWMGL
jgi:hypothetical protein